MDTILTLVNKGNDFLWSFLLLILLCGTGIYYTIRLKFIQVRKFGEGCKHVFGHFSLNGEKHEKGEMSPFQSIMTAIAAQVGTGNLAGAATALFGGGPGAIFWMWLSAFFGMATIYSEAVLAQTYKTEVNGEVTGGPVYYIKAAFKGNFGKVLSTLFAIFIVLALGFMGNMVQSNSIGAAFTEVFQVYGINIPPITIGLVLAVLAGFIFIGGTKRLAAVVEKVVPVMAGVYIVGSLILIGLHINHVPTAFMMIIKGAFDPKAVMGAGAGITVREAIRFGVARGLFSNEAGSGSAPCAAATAETSHPAKVGLMQAMGVFIDTLLCTCTAMIMLLVPADKISGLEGMDLLQAAMSWHFGELGVIFIAVILWLFSFTTFIGILFYARSNVSYLFGDTWAAQTAYKILALIMMFVGGLTAYTFVWDLGDVGVGLMTVFNLIALIPMSKEALVSLRDYEAKYKKS